MRSFAFASILGVTCTPDPLARTAAGLEHGVFPGRLPWLPVDVDHGHHLHLRSQVRQPVLVLVVHSMMEFSQAVVLIERKRLPVRIYRFLCASAVQPLCLQLERQCGCDTHTLSDACFRSQQLNWWNQHVQSVLRALSPHYCLARGMYNISQVLQALK